MSYLSDKRAGLTKTDGEWADSEGDRAVAAWLELGLFTTIPALAIRDELESFATEMILRGMERKATRK